MDTGTLDSLHYIPVDVNGGMLGPLFPVVHDQLLCLADVEGVSWQCDLLPIDCLIVVVIRPTTVVLSVNLMMVLGS